MNSANENIIEELRNLKCGQLIDLQSVNTFSAPHVSYFSNNLENIEEKGKLLPYAAKSIYELPNGYFDRQLNDLIDWITIENARPEEMVEFLSFEKEKIALPFQVPSNYFEQLSPEFLITEEKIIEKKNRTKVISFFQNINKYVAAAIVLVLFSVGANLMLKIKEQKKDFQLLNNMNINNELADIPTDEIINYLNQSSSKNMDYLINPNGKSLIDKSMTPKESVKANENSNIEILESLSQDDHEF